MHSLAELKSLLREHGREILETPGMYLLTNYELWTMKFDEYYCDGKLMKRKDIVKYLKATQRKNNDRKSSKAGNSRRSIGRSGERNRKVSNAKKPSRRGITANRGR